MTARILLVRHGRSAHAMTGWHSSSGMREWFKAYDIASLADDDRPPASLMAMATEANVIMSSDLPRALRSVALLAGERGHLTSPLLRELDLAIPDFGRAQLPIAAWAVMIGLRWAYSRRGGRFPSIRQGEQVRDAAAMLAEQAGRDRTVLAVTHGTVRTAIAAELVKAGWRRQPGGQKYSHWGVWTLLR